MRIVIDLQGAQTESRYRGIGRYSLSLARAIAKQATAHEVFIVLNGRLHENIEELFQAFSGLISRENIRIFDVPAPLAEVDPKNLVRSRVAEKIREDFIQRMDPDAVLITSLFEGISDDAVASVGAFCDGGNTAVILYDLIPLLNPKAYLNTDAHRNFYRQKIQYLKNAGLLLAISDYSCQEAIETLGIAPSKVVSISTAIDERFRIYSREKTFPLLQRLGISKKMVLCAPGGFDPRKNIENLIQAYSLLTPEIRSDHQLVIASKMTEENKNRLEKIRKSTGLKDDELILTDYLQDEDLVKLYSEATLFVFPSKHEGFGLPVLEAMTCGAPVVGSNATSIPEVIGCEEALFDPDSAVAISQKMNRALSDVLFRERLRQNGMVQSQKFSWDDCARKAIKALGDLKSSAGNRVSPNDSKSLISSIMQTPKINEIGEEELAEIAECITFNLPLARSREVLLDISVLVREDVKSGIQRVVRSLLLALLSSPPDNVAVRPIYFDDAGNYRYANHFVSKIAEHSLWEGEDEIVEFHQDDIYLALDLNAHLASLAHPYHQVLRRRGVQLYFIVYDLLLIHHPEWWVKGISQIFESWLRNICDVASGLLCISASVADEVHEWLRQNPPKRQILPNVQSFHLGADMQNSAPTRGVPDDASDVLSKLAKRTTFLTVGTLEPRKGHAQMLKAFERLWQHYEDVNLVIVGKKGWLVEPLVADLQSHIELGHRLFWLEGISDEYLEKIYSCSDCLIAASEGEGFGLPLIEAAQHKKPLIVRDIPVFREVAQNHAFYFSGTESEDLAIAIENWLQLHKQGLAPSSENMPWLTWKQSAELLKEKLFPRNSFS